MSISCLNKAIQVKGLKPTEKLILIILANYADEKGSCYPSHQHIADIAGLKDLKHIRSILAKFKKLGHLKVEHRFRPDGGNISNRYHLSITLDEAVEQSIRGEGVQTPTGTQPPTPDVSTPLEVEGYTPTNTKEKKQKKDTDNEFESFWKLYPRKVGKHQARVRYEKEIKSCSPSAMKMWLKRFVEETEFNKTEEQFIPHCATWLNQRRYLDYSSNDYKKKMKKTNLNAIAG